MRSEFCQVVQSRLRLRKMLFKKDIARILRRRWRDGEAGEIEIDYRIVGHYFNSTLQFHCLVPGRPALPESLLPRIWPE